MTSVLGKIDSGIRTTLPAASCFLFVLLSVVPWPSPIMPALLDPVPMTILCYWVVHRPDLFPMGWTLIIGFLRDALSGQFLGITTLSYLIADLILRSQRTLFSNQSFFIIWLIYSLTLAGAYLLQWALSCLVAWHLLDILPLLLRIVFGIVFFPLLSGLMQGRQPSLGRV